MDYLSWSKERGKEISCDSMWEYVQNNRQHAQSNKDAEIFFLWLQKRSVQVRHVSLIGWLNIKDAGMKVLGESCSRLESLTLHRCYDIHEQGIEDLAKG